MRNFGLRLEQHWRSAKWLRLPFEYRWERTYGRSRLRALIYAVRSIRQIGPVA